MGFFMIRTDDKSNRNWNSLGESPENSTFVIFQMQKCTLMAFTLTVQFNDRKALSELDWIATLVERVTPTTFLPFLP